MPKVDRTPDGAGTPSPGTQLPPDSVECPKCGADVQLPANTCPSCGKHLFLLCPACDQPNFRANIVCDACGAPLRRSHRPAQPPIHRYVWPMDWRVQSGRKWLLPVQLGLFVTCVALTTLAVIRIAEYQRSKRAPDPPEVYVIENGKLKPIDQVLKR